MDLQTLIFMGPSGSGKGTQAKLLTQYLREHDLERETLMVETGAGFRKFIEQDHYSAQIEKDWMERGIRAPDFLAINIWSSYLIRKMSDGEQHLLIEGAPRSMSEALALKTVMPFYNRKNPTVLSFMASREWSIERMQERGRMDDDLENINKRLDWYDKDVLPAVELYRTSDELTFVEVNAEQPIEDVHEEILAKLNLKK